MADLTFNIDDYCGHRWIFQQTGDSTSAISQVCILTFWVIAAALHCSVVQGLCGRVAQ